MHVQSISGIPQFPRRVNGNLVSDRQRCERTFDRIEKRVCDFNAFTQE